MQDAGGIDNPYQGSSVVLPQEPAASLRALYAPPAWKVVLLSVLTLGWYDIYWFYRNWSAIRRISGERLSAPWRSILWPFFMVPCLYRMRALVDGAGQRWVGHPWVLWTLYVALLAIARVSMIGTVPAMLMTPLVLVWAGTQARRYNVAHGLPVAAQGRFGPWHALVCLVGSGIWAGMLLLILPPLLALLGH